MARAPLLIFLDSDVVVRSDFIQAHLHFHYQRGTGWIGQGPIILTHDEQDPTQTPFSLWTDASRARFATGNVSVARDAMLKSGGFDPAFHQYGWEDLELGVRLRKQGLKMATVKKAPGFHLEPRFDPAQWSMLSQKERERARGAWLFFQKHPCLEVKLMTQLTPFHFLLDSLIQGIVLHHQTSQAYLAALPPTYPEKKRLALSRLCLNHDYLKALREIRQTAHTHIRYKTN
jgi:hypothetical protein